MAEMVSSAVVQETVSQILSSLVQKYEEKEKSNMNRDLERLEMAHIRLEAALETSGRWHITDTSMLRWRRKLKRAAQECDDTLHKCKQRILEEEQMDQEVRNSSLPYRIAHATKSFVFSVFNHVNSDLSRSVVQRFEWYADGASEFLRFIEFGGTPDGHMPFDSLVKNLLAGKELHHKNICGNQHPLFQLWLEPFRTAKHGIVANLIFLQKDGTSPEGNIYFCMIVQLSESTDIVGIAIECLQFFAPHFKCTVENILKELTQLHTQNFSWVTPVYSYQKEHLDNMYSLGSQWFRPNPLCCKPHDRHELRRISNLDMEGLPNVSLEPLIEFYLHCQISPSVHNKQKAALLSEDIISLQDSPCLKAGIAFQPHGSSGDMLPSNQSSAIAAIVGEKKHCLHTDTTLEQLVEIMLPQAIDYFHQNAKATVYRMIWKSKHGSGRIHVEKASMSTRRTRMRTKRTFGDAMERKLLQLQDQELWSQTHRISYFLDLWGAHVPVQLRNSLMDWVQKEKESQLAGPQLHLKY